MTKKILLALLVMFCFDACVDQRKQEIKAKIKVLNTELLELKNEYETLELLDKTEEPFIKLEREAIELKTDKKEKAEAHRNLGLRLLAKAKKYESVSNRMEKKQKEIDSLNLLLK